MCHVSIPAWTLNGLGADCCHLQRSLSPRSAEAAQEILKRRHIKAAAPPRLSAAGSCTRRRQGRCHSYTLSTQNTPISPVKTGVKSTFTSSEVEDRICHVW